MKKCSVCSSPRRGEIDTCLISNGSLRDIAGRFEVSRSALDRHKKHLPKTLTLAKQAEEIAEATTLLTRVERLMIRIEGIADKAAAARQWNGAVAAAKELRCCLELLGKLSGELQQGGTRIGIGIGLPPDFSIRDLTDAQLEDLAEILGAGLDEEQKASSKQLSG